MTDKKEQRPAPNQQQHAVDEENSTATPPLALTWGFGAFCVLNVAMLSSLPPVLRGRGAPYLPTFRAHRQAMFRQLQETATDRPKHTFVDLGSGDGRLVFAAIQQQQQPQNSTTFQRSIGYESNPFLYLVSQGQRFLMGPKYWYRTQFYWKDLWKADLRQVDVVAVYGLGPIMKDLGIKLKSELPKGALVVSNVFSFPGWTPVNSSSKGTHIYRMPPTESCKDADC